VVAVAETIFRVGAAGLRVGQILASLVISAGACATPPRPPPPPDLVIPRLDRDAGTAALGGDGVRFGHPPAAVGMAWTVELRATSRSADGPINPSGGGEQVSVYESTYRVDVLEVAGPAPSRVKLRFLRNVHFYQESPLPTAIDGKEYIVDARAPHVRDATGAAVPTAESERVLDIFPDLGTRARIDEVLPDEALAIGARRDELAGAILRVIHPRAWTLRAGTATLVRVEGAHAVFEISLDAASESGLRLEVHGEARVRREDARLSELVLRGGYEPKDRGSTDPPGSFEMRRTVTSEGEARNAR
jgi:hypothetical protein